MREFYLHLFETSSIYLRRLIENIQNLKDYVDQSFQIQM